jgi:hypothetical protein
MVSLKSTQDAIKAMEATPLAIETLNETFGNGLGTLLYSKDDGGALANKDIANFE